MRDIKLLTQTARAIWGNGKLVRRIRTGASGAAFYAGDKLLNGQAVDDLVNDGWLISTGQRTAYMEHLPPYAGV